MDKLSLDQLPLTQNSTESEKSVERPCDLDPQEVAAPVAEFRKKDPPKASPARTQLILRDPATNIRSKIDIWVEGSNFYSTPPLPQAASDADARSKSDIWAEGSNIHSTPLDDGGHAIKPKHKRGKPKKPPKPVPPDHDAYLVIGFDTEFKTPDNPFTLQEIKDKAGKYEVLSYQFYCKVYDDKQPDAGEWNGICYPESGSAESRLELSQLILFAVWKGISTGAVKVIPRTIYLVGHFTRADIPAFKDFANQTAYLSAVRGTFLNIDKHIPIRFAVENAEPVDLRVHIRDTFLLTPTASKGLAALGDIVEVPKVKLSDDPAKELFYKKNMDRLLVDDPGLFERYALTDAEICAKYIDQLLVESKALTGSSKIPVTFTSLGVKLLEKTWKDDCGWNRLDLLGKEEIWEKQFVKKLGYSIRKKSEVDCPEVYRHLASATEAYHGGRGEQFWFGPCFEDNWTDYDLTSAYPTAMALIGKPDWKSSRVSLNVDDFTPQTLGVCQVEFKFPSSVRFPTLPVRTEHGLIFPLEGVSDCAAPEVALAKSLGAELKIRHGVIVPTENETPIFRDFIKKCLDNRTRYAKGTLQNLFWKELSNGTYGKTAQGLHPKRVYDLRSRETKQLPPSQITNPYFAAFITSYVRGVLGEIINNLPQDVCVFSCTTDGFLTNATAQQIKHAACGPLAALYAESRRALTNGSESSVLDVKHRVRQPLGWRTRGQATIIPADGDPSDESNFVLAKGGIHVPEYTDNIADKNAYILQLFKSRTPQTKIDFKLKTGVRDIVEHDADLVEKQISKRLSMDYDWKRRPHTVGYDDAFGHVFFSTVAWDNIDQFLAVRECWEKQWLADKPERKSKAKDNPTAEPKKPAKLKKPPEPKSYCIKTAADFSRFATSVLTSTSLGRANGTYLNSKAPDLTRLRQSLCAAWKHSQAGLIWREGDVSRAQFAVMLNEAGVPCTKFDVGNDVRKKQFTPHNCPPTPAVLAALERLKARQPNLVVDDFLAASDLAIDLTQAFPKSRPS